ncbi:MAG: response regulator [Candidatus Brocadiae bacterium]|nr:response regulator [Candidatus Brocadiia bacterium]
MNQSGNILVVDDNRMNRIKLSLSLQQQGYVVSVAENGKEALSIAQKEPFDLILLDIVMPEMDGYQVLEVLKADKILRNIPVIVISAIEEMEAAIRCISMGAEDFLPKPFDPVLLKARIGASLKKKWFYDQEQAYLKQIQLEREKSDMLLLNILPQTIAEQLKENQIKQDKSIIAQYFHEVTVLFADIVHFTELSNSKSPTELVILLNQIFSLFDKLAEQHKLEKIKTIGDAYMIVGGLPVPRQDHSESVAQMAINMQKEIAKINQERIQPLSIRIGIHTGPVVAGVIGTRKFSYDLWGDTVNTASRMESHGISGSIQVSSATYEKLKEKYILEQRGNISIKGKGEMMTYLLIAEKS